MLEKNRFILSVVFMANIFTAGNVLAEGLNSSLTQSRETVIPETQNKLIDWSENVTAVLNKKMDNQLQQMIEHVGRPLLVEQQTSNVLCSLGQQVVSGSKFN